MTSQRGTIGKGDLVKRRQSGGHVMTVVSIDVPSRRIITSYTTPDGQRHNEEWSAGDLKRVSL